MPRNKLILNIALLVSLRVAAFAQETSCPSWQGNFPLTSASVFDGRPAEKADLKPDVSRGSGDRAYASWDIGYLFDMGRIPFLVCRYGVDKDAKTATVKVAKKVNRCVFQAHGQAKPAELICK